MFCKRSERFMSVALSYMKVTTYAIRCWKKTIRIKQQHIDLSWLFYQSSCNAIRTSIPHDWVREKRRKADITRIDRFHCHRINTAQKNKVETVLWKKPRKWNVAKDWFINNFSKSQVYMAHSFRVIAKTSHAPSWSFVYGDAIFVHSFGTQIWPPEINKMSGVHFFYSSPFFSLKS